MLACNDGRIMTAQRAYEVGLVNRVVPDGEQIEKDERTNMRHKCKLVCRSFSVSLFFILLASLLGCVAGTESVVKQNKTLILQEKKYNEARANLEKAVKTDPNNPELWYWLGVARFEETTPEATIEAFNRALDLRLPIAYRWVSYHYLGLCNQRLLKYDEAIKNFTECLKLNPGHLPAIESRGWAYLMTRQFDQAHKDFDSVLKKNHNHLGSLRGKGWALYQEGDYDQAIIYLTRMINITPSTHTDILADAYSGRGHSYYSLSQFESARNDLDTAIQTIDPKNTLAIQKATVVKAFCLLGLGDMETALALIDQVEKYSPPGQNLNFERALIYYLSGDKQKAWHLRGGAGMIGVFLNPNQDGERGIYIESIEKDGPASKSGLLKGDLITTLNGEVVTDIKYFVNRVTQMDPGTTALIRIIREGFEKQIRVQVGSAEKYLANHFLSKPILAARKAPLQLEKMPISTINIPVMKQNELNVSGAGNLGSMIIGSKKTETATIKIESVLIEPAPVQAGANFEVIIELVVSDPADSRPSLPVMMDYSVSKDNNLLKQFKSKTFIIPNGEHYTLIRRPKATTRKGAYSMLIELAYKENKASKTLEFYIE